jgi:hypothetical protein
MNYEKSENPSSHEYPLSPLFSHQLLIGQRHKQNPITDWTESYLGPSDKNGLKICEAPIRKRHKSRSAICKRRKPRSTNSLKAKAAKSLFGRGEGREAQIR